MYNPTAKLQIFFHITTILCIEVFILIIWKFEKKAFTLQQIRP